MDFGACATEVNDRTIVLRDKKSGNPCRMVFNNPEQKKITKVIIDGCVINDGIRCDYLVIVDKTEYYVELKGSEVKHAIEQLRRTIQIVSKDAQKQTKLCFVVSSRCPIFSTQIQEIKLSFKKLYNATIVIKNHFCEHSL